MDNEDRSVEIDSIAVAIFAVENELRLIQLKQNMLNELALGLGHQINHMVRLTKIKIRKIKDKRKKAARTAAKD